MESFYAEFMKYLGIVNGFVWGPVMLVLLVGTGFYLTVGMRFFSFRKLPYACKRLITARKHVGEGEISPFNAMMTAMAATVGTGNIAGVATAIFAGGPGALFWMWVTALVGMATKFSEILLAVHYRETTPGGNIVGGAMHFIGKGLGPKWAWLGTLFAFFTVVACFGIGNMTQCNSIGQSLNATFGIPNWVSAIALFVMILAVVLGGLKRIGDVAGKVVPFMAILYVIVALVILALNIDKIPDMFVYVVKDAFTPTAASGGFLGATVMMAIQKGMARGVFSNEAGLGSAPIAHATSATDTPMNQAVLGLLEVFIDTIVICTMTGFVILLTGAWTSGVDGAALSSRAFESALPGFGAMICTVCLTLFAFTTVLGWCVYGERCAIYLFGDKALVPFRILFSLVVPIGTLIPLKLAWDLADTFNAMMAIPNLIGLLLLSPVIFRLVREYEAEEKAKKKK